MVAPSAAGGWLLLVLIASVGTDKGSPPKKPPKAILGELTQQHQIPMQYYYVDDSNKGQGTHYKFSYEDISHMISDARTLINTAIRTTPFPPTSPSSSSAPSSLMLSHLTDMWFIHALRKYPVSGANIVIFGSTSPWYESLALALGAEHVTVLEYNRLTYDHPNITTMLAQELQEERPTKLYDAAFSLSSFDHDGLGRYGDPIDPMADICAMKTARNVLKPGGLLYLTVPIGPDLVVWNLHRRYGRLRLHHLLSGWEEVERVGWNEELLDVEASYMKTYEPVFVLRAI